jgi:hypothetical protein
MAMAGGDTVMVQPTAAGAYAGYAYGSSNDGDYSDSDCYYAYSHHQRVLVCN